MPEGLFFDIACAPIFAPKCPVFAPNGCHKQYTKGLVRHDKKPCNRNGYRVFHWWTIQDLNL